jgi:hypothetical protein
LPTALDTAERFCLSFKGLGKDALVGSVEASLERWLVSLRGALRSSQHMPIPSSPGFGDCAPRAGTADLPTGPDQDFGFCGRSVRGGVARYFRKRASTIPEHTRARKFTPSQIGKCTGDLLHLGQSGPSLAWDSCMANLKRDIPRGSGRWPRV